MPRIDAATVKEHREQVLNALVDAAEEALREDGAAVLTAEAVSSKAGRARNSIYRYVSSVEELRLLVLERYLPAWADAIKTGMADCETPKAKIAAWARAALAQASQTGHGWFMSVMSHRRAAGANPPVERVAAIHRSLMSPLVQQWRELGVEDHRLATELTVQMVSVGMRRIDQGAALEPLSDRICAAVGALVDSFSS